MASVRRCALLGSVLCCPGLAVFAFPAAVARRTDPQSRSHCRFIPSAAAIHPAARQAGESLRTLPAERHTLFRDHGVELSGALPHAADQVRCAATQPGNHGISISSAAGRHCDVAVRACTSIDSASVRQLRPPCQSEVRALGAALGLVVLGLGKRPAAGVSIRQHSWDGYSMPCCAAARAAGGSTSGWR